MQSLIQIEALWVPLIWGRRDCHETPQNMKIMKIMKILKILICSRLWLSEDGAGASERCASAQCSNNLQRRGFEVCK